MKDTPWISQAPPKSLESKRRRLGAKSSSALTIAMAMAPMMALGPVASIPAEASARALSTAAQNDAPPDVVNLKDGGMVRGTIVTVEEHVRIVVEDEWGEELEVADPAGIEL